MAISYSGGCVLSSPHWAPGLFGIERGGRESVGEGSTVELVGYKLIFG